MASRGPGRLSNAGKGISWTHFNGTWPPTMTKEQGTLEVLRKLKEQREAKANQANKEK